MEREEKGMSEGEMEKEEKDEMRETDEDREFEDKELREPMRNEREDAEREIEREERDEDEDDPELLEILRRQEQEEMRKTELEKKQREQQREFRNKRLKEARRKQAEKIRHKQQEELRKQAILKMIIPRLLPKDSYEELVEKYGSAEADYILERRKRYSSDADRNVFAVPKPKSPPKKREGVDREYHAENKESLLSQVAKKLIAQVADAFSKHRKGWAPNAHDGGDLQYRPPGTEHLAATVEGPPQREGNTVAETRHEKPEDETKQESTKRRIAALVSGIPRTKAAVKIIMEELYKQAQSLAAAIEAERRAAGAAGDQLQLADVDTDEAVESALRKSLEELVQEKRKRREMRRQRAEPSASPTNKGKREEEAAMRIALESESEAESRPRHEEHHDQDAEKIEAKKETQPLKIVLRLPKWSAAPTKPTDELDEARALRLEAERRNELQPAHVGFDEAVDWALRRSLDENRERREIDRQAEGSATSQTNIRNRELEEAAVRIALERSEVEARARGAARDEAHHDQDVEQEQEDQAAAERQARKGKQKLRER